MTRPLRELPAIVAGVATRVPEVDGDGPPILLLHGFTDSADSWRPLIKELAD
jgi:pimeloyl-ACP methyl ester carboxylesterase